jgi:hypothetical protein
VPDPSLPRKVVAAAFNVPLADGHLDGGTVAGGTVAELIDSGAPLVEVRMETP